jgi:pimeloyl-ACP methyl ester carboxylesterase
MSTSHRRTAVVDELVGVAGGRVHVRCTGSGDVTVVLISGFEAGSGVWGAVEPTISERTRVCAYDRPGTGTSDPATAIATFTSQAHDLHALLDTVGESEPYVVVGHSFGGVVAVSFASAFPDEVTGLVLVDASPVGWPDALCAVADDGSDAATTVRDLCAAWSDPTGNSEHLDVFTAFADAATTTTSLGSLPMAVITAVDRHLPAGLAADEMRRLTDTWNLGQRHWSRLSTGSRLVPVDDTSHDIQLDHPDVVIDEVTRLLP